MSDVDPATRLRARALRDKALSKVRNREDTRLRRLEAEIAEQAPVAANTAFGVVVFPDANVWEAIRATAGADPKASVDSYVDNLTKSVGRKAPAARHVGDKLAVKQAFAELTTPGGIFEGFETIVVRSPSPYVVIKEGGDGEVRTTSGRTRDSKDVKPR